MVAPPTCMHDVHTEVWALPCAHGQLPADSGDLHLCLGVIMRTRPQILRLQPLRTGQLLAFGGEALPAMLHCCQTSTSGTHLHLTVWRRCWRVIAHIDRSQAGECNTRAQSLRCGDADNLFDKTLHDARCRDYVQTFFGTPFWSSTD